MALKKDKLYIGILIVFIVVLVITVFAVLFVSPEVYEEQCKNRVFSDFESTLSGQKISANICIVQDKVVKDGNTENHSFSLGASGAVIGRNDGRYYAITACHVINDAAAHNNVALYIIPCGSPSYSQEKEKYSGLIEYYQSFPSAKIEYYDKNFDLAVVSFVSSRTLDILPISKDELSKDLQIAVISNPEGRRFIRSYGTVTSEKTISFSADDQLGNTPVICHNAYIAPGSSGSAAINIKGEIVGINIGGGTDFLGRYKYSAMVSCRDIREFLKSNSQIIFDGIDY